MPSCEEHTTDPLGKGPNFTGLLRKEPYLGYCSIRANFRGSKFNKLRYFVLRHRTIYARKPRT